ncbi:MAG: sugar transferase, partial [Syntrophorhabdaceae bacterium]|nr:sugar transferase [Syntrophorhabdaceae bacterium]
MKKGLYYHNLIFLVVDILTIYLSIVLAFYTRPVIGLVIPLVPLSHDLTVYLYKFWIIITIIVLIAYYRGYSLIINVWDELLIFLKVLSISFLLVWMIISLQKGGEKVSRIIITLSFFYMLFLMPLMRFIFKYIMYKIYELRKPAYIFYSGWGKTTDELISIINREWYSGYRIDGYIDNLLDLKKREIEVCFVPIKSIDEEKIKSIKPYVKHFILISEIPGLSFMNTEIKTFLNSNIALITVSKGLLSTQRIFIKRMLDVFLSILGLILFLPFFLIIPLMIKMDSKGPVI